MGRPPQRRRPVERKTRIDATPGPTPAEIGTGIASGATRRLLAARYGISEEAVAELEQRWFDQMSTRPVDEQRRVLVAQYEQIVAVQGALARELANAGKHTAAARATTLQMNAMAALRQVIGVDAPKHVDVTSGGAPLGASPEQLAAFTEQIRTTIDSYTDVITVQAVPTGELDGPDVPDPG